MVSSIDVKLNTRRYEAAPPRMRRAIDDAFKAAIKPLVKADLAVAADERAEELVAAITHFVVRCNPEVEPATAAATAV